MCERVFTMNFLLALSAILVLAIVSGIVWFTQRFDVKSKWLDPQPILSAATLVLGFLLLIWQLATQDRKSLEANRRQGQDRLKLDIFKAIAERIEATSVPLTQLAMVPTAFIGELIIRKTSGVASRYQAALQTAPSDASDSITKLIAILEIYEIAMPEFK